MSYEIELDNMTSELTEEIMILKQRINFLEKENTKLKCLAQRLFSIVAESKRAEWKVVAECGIIHNMKHTYMNHVLRWERIANECKRAYRKAKKALMEGK